jgi:hypothetical protein
VAATRTPAGPEQAEPRRRWPEVLAWALYGLVLALFATYPVLDRLMRDAGRPDLALLAPFVVAPTLAALTAATVGVVVARRRPGHPVGWLLLTVGLTMAAGGLIAGYLPYTVVVRRARCRPGACWAGSTRPRPTWPWPRSGSCCCSRPPGRRPRPAGAASGPPRRPPWSCWRWRPPSPQGRWTPPS